VEETFDVVRLLLLPNFFLLFLRDLPVRLRPRKKNLFVKIGRSRPRRKDKRKKKKKLNK
jgi:hypothetical protein